MALTNWWDYKATDYNFGADPISGNVAQPNPSAVAASNAPVPSDNGSAAPFSGSVGGVDLGGSNGWGGFGGGDSGGGGGFGSFGGAGGIKLALGGLETIAGIWDTWQRNKLAKEALSLQKKATNINLANQIMAYNTTLEDRIANRVLSGGWSQAKGDAWTAGHRLANRQI